MRTRAHPLRRLIALLCGVLMMHTSWMAASAACETPAARTTIEASASPQHAQAQAHHHGAVPAPDAPPSHHGSSTTTCPMAMACTLSVMTADVPVVALQTVAFTTLAPVHVASAPRSTASAPEPPPPRA